MMRKWCAALAVFVVAACGHNGAAPVPGGSTTTGMLPAGVPTEGTRPPANGLPGAAEPQKAPPPQNAPIGRIVEVGHAPEGIVADAVTRTVAVATHDPNELVLLRADSGDIVARIPLPGRVRHLQLAAPGGPVLVPVESADSLVRVDLPQGPAHAPIRTGTEPHDATQAANGTVFVANELGGTVTVLRGEQVVKVFTDSVQPAGSAATGTTVGVLDVRKNDLTVYDAERLSIVGSTPAGDGPTHLVADRHGRLIATDTRGDAVRVFTPLPAPREVARIAQPGGPYGVAYDTTRDLLWVASSGTNEIIGYDMSDPTPRQVLRFPTVQNPYSVAVDPDTGRLFVAGVSGGVVQVIDTAP